MVETEREVKKQGIVMLIFDSEGRLFTVRELTSKPTTGKNVGEVGVPCETSESGEHFGRTLKRGIGEELGIGSNWGRYLDLRTVVYLGFQPFRPDKGVYAHVIKVQCIDPDGLEKSCREKGDGEVAPNGWMKSEDLFKQSDIRVGVKNVLTQIESII
jgi:hypothetical protein